MCRPRHAGSEPRAKGRVSRGGSVHERGTNPRRRPAGTAPTTSLFSAAQPAPRDAPQVPVLVRHTRLVPSRRVQHPDLLTGDGLVPPAWRDLLRALAPPAAGAFELVVQQVRQAL